MNSVVSGGHNAKVGAERYEFGAANLGATSTKFGWKLKKIFNIVWPILALLNPVHYSSL